MSLETQMSKALQLPVGYITKLSNTASFCYKTYVVPKRNGKGNREIHHPSRELKSLQRWLLYNVIAEWPVHTSATAYKKGSGILYNASLHGASNYLLRIDLRGFFPSITWHDVIRYSEARSADIGWDEEDRLLFVKIVCRRKRLTIGAPTSPALSNVVCYDLDGVLASLAMKEDVIYSRYADDMFFSTERRDVLGKLAVEVVKTVEGVALPANLKVNHEKTRHLSRRGRRIVTGIVLGSGGELSIGRGRKRYIRSLIHRYDDLEPKQREHLAGLLAFAKSIEPDFINALILKYGVDRMEAVRRSNPGRDGG